MPNPIKEFFNNFWFFNRVRSLFAPSLIRKRKDMFLFDDSEFYRVNLNCGGDAYFGYVNIEDRRTKGRVLVSPMHRLPFSDNRAKLIFLDFKTVQNNKKLDRIFQEISRVIVPNGLLSIDNIRLNNELIAKLSKLGFSWIFKHYQRRLSAAYFTYSPPPGEFKKSDRFDFQPQEGKLLNVLEYMSPEEIEPFLLDLERKLSPGAKLEILVRNESFSEDGKFISFFDKGNLAQYLTEAGFLFDKMELRGRDIYAIVRKRPSLNLKIHKPKRVCAIGQYMMIRYNQLGFDWDGIPRALDELGHENIQLEGMRNMPYKELHRAILSYKPDYIFLTLKETLPLLFDVKEDLKKIGTKTIFWFTDPDEPWDMDLKGVLDYMFISNAGQIEAYKKAFNIENIYFMAQPCTPSMMHHCDLPEIYDIGFTGALSKAGLHTTRRKVVDLLSGKYKVAARNNMRNNVAEFYSQSKIVFGASDFKAELYTSNRIFVAMSCARAYLTNKFPGIERLFENKKHLLWFEDCEEVLPIVDYYLKNEPQRRKIEENAEQIAHSKHTYKHRLENIFDIVEGKTEEFYGFLQ